MRHLFSIATAMVLTVESLSAASAGPLSLQNYFNGKLVAKGTVEDLRENTKRDFTIAMIANWSGPVGTLTEDVAYADGQRERKVWTFTKIGEGHYTGHREDLTRDADVIEDDKGVTMSYKARTRVPSGSTYNLSFEDRLTPTSKDVVAVRSDVSYLFLSAARVSMTITRSR